MIGKVRTRRSAAVVVASLVVLSGLVILAQQGDAKPGNDANGKKLYLTYCFVCHGVTGKGDGPASATLDPKPRDHTNDAYMSSRTDEQLFNAISKGGAGFAGGSVHMPNWDETLKEQERWDLVAYLRVLHRPKHAEGNVEEGKRLYQSYCANCHGVTGKGDGPLAAVLSPRPRDHTDAEKMSHLTDKDIFNVISQGGVATQASRFMPPWSGVLSNEQIWSLVAYVRRLAAK
ncbi:MAG: c-type cytochrome [Candidatus Tectomicrobia bacterium]|nr:c-type cytochrome [Candidatus Tectomicrobia bacterium]